jgi:hypothetical protein
MTHLVFPTINNNSYAYSSHFLTSFNYSSIAQATGSSLYTAATEATV